MQLGWEQVYSEDGNRCRKDGNSCSKDVNRCSEDGNSFITNIVDKNYAVMMV